MGTLWLNTTPKFVPYAALFGAHFKEKQVFGLFGNLLFAAVTSIRKLFVVLTRHCFGHGSHGNYFLVMVSLYVILTHANYEPFEICCGASLRVLPSCFKWKWGGWF
jgi:hypothetical protein